MASVKPKQLNSGPVRQDAGLLFFEWSLVAHALRCAGAETHHLDELARLMGAVQRLTDVCADPSRANDHDLALAKQLLEAYGEDATQTMAEWPTAAQQPPRDRPVIAAILDRYKVRGGRALARYPQVLWIAHLAAEHFEGFDSLIAELEVEYDCTIPKCNDGLGFPSPLCDASIALSRCPRLWKWMEGQDAV